MIKAQKKILIIALGALFMSSASQAVIRGSEETDPIQGRKPYIEKILPTGKLFEGEVITLAPNPARIYEPLDKDFDIKKSETTDTDGIFLGDLSLTTVQWFLLEANQEVISESTPVAGTGVSFTIPADAAGKKVAYRVTATSETGLPKVGNPLAVPNVTKIAGQDEDGNPLPPVTPPVDKGPEPGPDPDNPDVIGPDPESLKVQIFIADESGEPTDKYILDETGHLAPENKLQISEVDTTYVVKIVSKGTKADGTGDRNFTELFQKSIIWRLKDGSNPHVILDGKQTVGPETTPVNTKGQLTFTTQLNNLVAQSLHSTNTSEQGMTLSILFDDGTR